MVKALTSITSVAILAVIGVFCVDLFRDYQDAKERADVAQCIGAVFRAAMAQDVNLITGADEFACVGAKIDMDVAYRQELTNLYQKPTMTPMWDEASGGWR